MSACKYTIDAESRLVTFKNPFKGEDRTVMISEHMSLEANALKLARKYYAEMEAASGGVLKLTKAKAKAKKVVVEEETTDLVNFAFPTEEDE